MRLMGSRSGAILKSRSLVGRKGKVGFILFGFLFVGIPCTAQDTLHRASCKEPYP